MLLALDEAAQSAVILRGYRAIRIEFGLNRIQLGAHLHLIKDHKLWKGIAESWEEFLASENVNPNAARQYINVAKKFVYELDLDDETLRKLSLAGISALEKASKVINDTNKDELIAALTSLSERDAIQRILEISSTAEAGEGAQVVTPTLRVLKVLREYHELPPDMQQDFRDRLTFHERQRKTKKDLAEKDNHPDGQGDKSVKSVNNAQNNSENKNERSRPGIVFRTKSNRSQ